MTICVVLLFCQLDGTCKLADFGASHQMRDLASRYGGFKSFKGTV